MLTRFNKMVLRMLPAPFFGWLAGLMFVLLMQFLIKHMPDLVGKGLPLGAVIELVIYSLAYMLVLAVPMSVLIATLTVFGRLGESRAYAVMKSAGVSFLQLAWPALLVSTLLAACMTYFNAVILPESNFLTKVLWQDIRQKRPGFVLQPGVFYEGVSRYSILVREVEPTTGLMHDVTIFDYSDGPDKRTEMKAASGSIETLDGGARVVLTLNDGELHRLSKETYERIRFDRHTFGFDIDDLQFSRTDPSEGRRSDRTMRSSEMVRLVDSMHASIDEVRRDLIAAVPGYDPPESTDHDVLPSPAVVPGDDTSRGALAALSVEDARKVYLNAIATARLQRGEIDAAQRSIERQQAAIRRYEVEIHKKYSIAVACLVFMLIGAPLGLRMKRSSLAMTGAMATGIFVFYWVTLVFGEKLADRGFISPSIGMWIANVVTLIAAIYLVAYVSLDAGATAPLRRRLLDWIRK